MDEFIKLAGPDLKSVLPYLLSGGAGALAGGALTAATPERKDEDSSSRRKRILRNALLMGGGTAAGHAALSYGLPKFTAPIPKGEPSQLEAFAANLKTNPLYYLGGGAAAGAGVHRMAKGEEFRNMKANGVIKNEVKSKDIMAGVAADNAVKQHLSPKDHSKHLHNPSLENMTPQGFRDMGVNINKLRADVARAGPFGDVMGSPSTPKPGKGFFQRNRDGGNSLGGKLDKGIGQESDRLLRDRILGTGKRGTGKMKRLGLLAALLGTPQLTSWAANKSNPDAFQDK